jgi:DNA-binding NarL/FixJ family response regulator
MNAVVGIVERNKKIRDLIQCYLDLQNELSCPVAVDTIEELLEYLEDNKKPDVILVDTFNIKGIKLIKKNYPEIEIIGLTVFNNPNEIFDALCAGASGYLLKHTPLSKIKEFITGMDEGCSNMSPQIARKIMDYFKENGSRQNSLASLTLKEYNIVKGIVDGLSPKMIMERYEISANRVGFHIYEIYKKLNNNVRK